ncbi:MAG: hypothetical protein ACK4NY_05590 [Spirosomataceae bacterium]
MKRNELEKALNNIKENELGELIRDCYTVYRKGGFTPCRSCKIKEDFTRQNLNRWINENKNNCKILTNKNPLDFVLANNMTGLSSITKNKEGGIRKLYNEIVLTLFYDKCGISPKFDENTNILKSSKGSKFNSVYDYIDGIEEEANHYLFYYHRASSYDSKNHLKESEHVDKCKISIDSNWKTAKMYILYPKPKNGERESYTLELVCKEINYIDDKNPINLTFIQVENKETTFRNIFTILIKPQNNFKNSKFLTTSFTKIHQKRGFPTCGIGILEKVEETEINEKWNSAKQVDDIIHYKLNGKRYFALNLEDSSDNQSGLDKLKLFQGIYKGTMVYNQGENKEQIAIFYMRLFSNGNVQISTKDVLEYTGQYKLVYQSDSRNKNIIIDFNYNEKVDAYYSKFILDVPLSDSSSTIYGVAMYDGLPRISKVFFEKVNIEINDNITLKTFIDKLKDNKPNYYLIFNGEILTEEVRKIFFNINDEISKQKKNFFLEGLSHPRYSDAFILQKVSEEEHELHENLLGCYHLLSFTLEGGNKGIRKYKLKDATIWKYPVEFFKNGKTRMKLQNGEFVWGEVKNTLNNLTIHFFDEKLKLFALFEFPDELLYKDRDFNHIFGTLVRINRINNENISEGRVCVLFKQKDVNFDNLGVNEGLSYSKTENKNEKVNFEQLTEWDAIYNGNVSMLSGPNNRIVRAESNIQDAYPRLDENSYKKDYFYSACYLMYCYNESKEKSKNESEKIIKEVKNRLFAAWIHRFAATHYMDREIDSAEDYDDDKVQKSINQILIEQQELILAMKEKKIFNQDTSKMGFFANDEIREEIKRLWGEVLFKKDQELKEWLEKKLKR